MFSESGFARRVCSRWTAAVFAGGFVAGCVDETFLAVGTNSTIDGSALSKLELEGGTPAPAPLALQVLPTARVELVGGSLTVPNPDVLQILRENELTDMAANLPSGVTVFPYGFVVRRVGDNTTRMLPASPGAEQFDGVVDFAFSIPAQDNPADDPDKISVLMIAIDDSETRLTQGFQEQSAPDRLAQQQLAGTLVADTVTLLPGGTLPGFAGGLRTLCTVRTAAPPGSANGHLVNKDQQFQNFGPPPDSLISPNASIIAFFNAPVHGIGADNFTVRGLQSGPHFLGQDYVDDGTSPPETPPSYFQKLWIAG